MHWLGWVILGLALIEAGWLAIDGSHALINGDYITPKRGQYAGQLGPWSKLVTAVGIEPRSAVMMTIHVVIGFAWLAVMVAFALQYDWAWWGMLLCAIAAIWYLPFGTLLSIIQIVLLMLPQVRGG